MNTSAGYYQAPRPPRVPLDEVLIKLHPEGFHQEFEADGINVGAGGISMRASMLPEVGSSLRCLLDNPVGGEAIEMIGRVVWAHEKGPHAGEFGIRFTHLSEDDQLRIEALIQRWGRASAKAPTVRLRLDGVGSSIVAEIQSEDHSELRVEQPLPFLAIGSAVLNETSSRRGYLESVELEMDERTPKLVLNIGYEVGDSPVPPGDEGEHRDTLPDEIPASVAAPERREDRFHDAPRIVRYDRLAESASKQTSLDRVRAYAKVATGQLASSVGSAQMAVTQGLAPRITTNARELAALAGRFVAALRARLDEKPRRKQVPRSEAARAHLKNTRRNRRRYLIVAAMAAGIVLAGWMVYVWAASGSEEAAAEATSATTMAPDRASEPSAASASEPGTSGEVEASRSRRDEALAAEAAVEGDQAEGAPVPPQRIHGKAFGADSVAGGVKHVLRMNNPVSQMDGIIEKNGFSVTIPGSLSLSRAGPIAAAHPDVEHASILNRRDSSELTLRFVDGRKPEYRVEARGATIEITLAR